MLLVINKHNEEMDYTIGSLKKAILDTETNFRDRLYFTLESVEAKGYSKGWIDCVTFFIENGIDFCYNEAVNKKYDKLYEYYPMVMNKEDR